MPNVIDPTLTDHTIEIYAAILQAHNEFGIAPSYMELQHACRVSSPTVRKAIIELKKRGYVSAPKFQVRAIKPTDPDRTLANREPKPWEGMVKPRRYFKAGA